MPSFGKIAMLPTEIRNIVGQMLDENRPEVEIAKKITAILRKSAKPEIAAIQVSHQNVHNWRHGGYRKWQVEARAREVAEKIVLGRADGNKVADGTLADNIAACVASQFAVQATNLIGGETTEIERRKTIAWLIPQVAALRRVEHAKSWNKLEAIKVQLALSRAARRNQNMPESKP